MNRRIENRVVGNNVQYPIACVMRHDGKELVAEVVNYHYRGACLKLPKISTDDERSLLDGRYKLDFYLGRQCLQSDMPYRVCWDDFAENFMLGIEFINRSARLIERADRFMINRKFPPRVETFDPLDPNRLMLLDVADMSETGLLLSTSLTNKHVFPGMKLRDATVVIPGQPNLKADLLVENARKGSDDSSFYLGVSIVGDKSPYKQSLRGYLSQMLPVAGSLDDHFGKLSDAGLMSPRLKAAVTFRVVTTQDDYDEVLKLRFAGYGRHAKVKSGTTWRDQGEGLENEGQILAGVISGRIICAMELRFGDGKLPLRSEALIGSRHVPGMDLTRTVEVNKLVIHPKAQGSDIVLGLFQRAHAVIVNRGQVDVLLAATDRLLRLYEGIGAEGLGVRVPHPYLAGEHLNLMAIRRQVYHDGQRLNPLAWNTVYQAVHQYYADLGMVDARRLSLKGKTILKLSEKLRPVLIKLGGKKKKSRRAPPVKAAHRNASPTSERIDPKWTRQEFFSSVMHPYVVEASDMIGVAKVDEILDEIGVPRWYFSRQSNWLSVTFHDVFLDRFAAHGDPLELSKRAGTRSFKRDMIGVNYYVLKHFISPMPAFKSFAKLAQKFNRTRTYEVIESGSHRVKVAIGLRNAAYLPKRRESCANWQASFESFIELMTGRPGRVRKLSCCYDGHKSCTYEVAWELKPVRSLTVFAAITASLGIGSSSALAYGLSGVVGALATAGGLSLATASMAIWRYASSLRKKINASTREFQEFQVEASEKYSELQTAKARADEMFREAQVLEKTSRDIQQTEGLGDIVQATLNAACQNFDFDRAFAMLADESRQTLRTAAVAGVEGDAEMLWKFTVDVSKRRANAVVLSTVFHAGSPIVINDIEQHMFQLNESSRRLVEQFGSRGFIIVPVPARIGRWGVIVADKKRHERILDRDDVTVLERLSLQLGLALDKRSDFEREQRLRNHFQKYVPAAIVAEGLGREEPILGGQVRDIVAMFVDIRGFTAMAERLSPAATVEILNKFFSVLEPIATEYGGTIDKFLGDGALITWGALGKVEGDERRAVLAALTLSEQVAALSVRQISEGFMPIEVGIGLNYGPAIVGNIGSSNRMEFTSIGATVNFASRLETLCKTLGCDIVASPSLAAAVPSSFEVEENVVIRGVAEKQTVLVCRKPGAAVIRGKSAA